MGAEIPRQMRSREAAQSAARAADPAPRRKPGLSGWTAMAGPHGHRQRSINVSAVGLGWLEVNAVGARQKSASRWMPSTGRTHADLRYEASLKCRPCAKAVTRRWCISSG